jgi:transcriptional regulator with XRE-family HTH domain
MRTVERRSLVHEDRDLALAIGARLRAARLRTGMTQQQVAEGRYTKAYISALENGLAKPSLAALRFVAGRLGTTTNELLADADRSWARIEAELRLADGDWQAAVDRFGDLLADEPEGIERARLLLGLAEGLCRLNRAHEAIRIASEAEERFVRAGRRDEARRSRYWLAAAHHMSDNPGEARILFESILAEDSPDHPLGSDFRVRVLTALAAVMSQRGEPRRALALLEEARGIGADVDDRRRAAVLSSLAMGYRATGDMEAAMRAATQSLALYRVADALRESAAVENELALIYVELGNLRAAHRHSSEARRICERLKDEFLLAHSMETEARIALADGKPDVAARHASAAVELARRTDNHKAEVSALLTQARAARVAGERDRSAAILESAAGLARGGPPAHLREILSEWSDLLAEAGDHERAYALSREALALA